ncbi:MAG TPA: peptidoglycan editing factor PgeF [Thermomicrobiales bacterium]|nr:peptidoglycan editing factor PgeF [Thermomicrobiales bacterium]
MNDPVSRDVASTLPVPDPGPLRSGMLSGVPGVVHGLTYRVPGLGVADGNVGYGSPRDKADAWEMRQIWCRGIGVDPHRIVTMGQVHGRDVLRVTAQHAGSGATPNSTHAGVADALITDSPDVVLMTLHADCQPILIVDPERPAVAAVHAGWRGTVADVAGAAVQAMERAFGSEPAKLLAYPGPAIGVCCNEVGDEVIAAWRDQARDLGPLAELAVAHPGPKDHFDGSRANTLLLMRAGLTPDHIEVSDICTKCSKDSWFSHRGHGPGAGREGGLIALASPSE